MDGRSSILRDITDKMDRNFAPLKQLRFDLINILQILPAKSLSRFMSACKTWHYLIKSPQFIATHLSVNQQDSKGHRILILGKDLCYVLANQTLIQHLNLDFYIDYVGYWNTPVGSSNGLVLVPIGFSDDREYLLWNPSINKSRKLDSKVHSLYDEKPDRVMFNHEIFGLGFHESSKDHRVVRILYVIDNRTSGIGLVPTEVDVYNLCVDSWHKVDSSPGCLIGFSRGVFVNGAIHWLATTRFTSVTSSPENDYVESILLFHIEDECLKEMVLPEELHCIIDMTIAFNVFKGSLAVVTLEITYDSNTFVLWVMANYGVEESWTKRFTIPNTETHIERWPLGLLRCGILVYSEKEYEKLTFVFFHVDSSEAKNIEWLMGSAEIVDFMDSLVLCEG